MAIAKKTAAKKKSTKAKKTAVKKKPTPTKKATKKTAVKKAAPKKASKTVKKAATKKSKIKNAPSNKYFWVNNGGVLKNLKDLHEELLVMRTEQFEYHTQNGANHFAMWVDMVLMEPDCAKALTKAKTKKTAAKKVEDTLKKYL